MTETKKVLKGLECLITNEVPCGGCPYTESGYCVKNIAEDALELLKEQEPVKPELRMSKWGFKQWFICGACGDTITFKVNYCPYCGRKVKWDD